MDARSEFNLSKTIQDITITRITKVDITARSIRFVMLLPPYTIQLYSIAAKNARAKKKKVTSFKTQDSSYKSQVSAAPQGKEKLCGGAARLRPGRKTAGCDVAVSRVNHRTHRTCKSYRKCGKHGMGGMPGVSAN